MKDQKITNENNGLRHLLLGGPTAPEDLPHGFLAKAELSVEQFARMIGATRTSVYFYLNGQRKPSDSMLHKICNVVGLSYEQGLTFCTPALPGRPRR